MWGLRWGWRVVRGVVWGWWVSPVVVRAWSRWGSWGSGWVSPVMAWARVGRVGVV